MRFGTEDDKVITGFPAAIAEAKVLGEASRIQRLESLLAQYKQEAVDMNFDRIRLGREAMTMTWDDVVGRSQAERDRLHELVGANAGNLQKCWSLGAEWVLICGSSEIHSDIMSGDEGDSLPDEEGLRQLSQSKGDLMVWAFLRPTQLD